MSLSKEAKALGEQPAYPVSESVWNSATGCYPTFYLGITIRQLIFGRNVSALLSNSDIDLIDKPADLVSEAKLYTDALLEAMVKETK